MKIISVLFVLMTLSCNYHKINENNVIQDKKFDYTQLVYPSNYHKNTKNSPTQYLKNLKIPENLHKNDSVILQTCDLVIAVNENTYKIHGQTYPLEADLDVVKIIKNKYHGKLFFPVANHVFLSDLSGAASEIKNKYYKVE